MFENSLAGGLSLKALELRERPREKLQAYGVGSLSDMELVALLLGSGTKGKGVLSLAQAVLECIDGSGEKLSADELYAVPGVGVAKATAIVASLELARRRIRPRGTKVKGPVDVYNLVRHLSDRKQEAFIAVSLNGAHEVIATRVITVGLLDRTQVHPREVYADIIADRAAAVIVAHNHPSGELTPSKEDIAVTKRLGEAGKILGVNLLDHIVFGELGFVSLVELGLY